MVDDFSIRVERGQIFGFLGPNGSGKTTTIRMLCGLLTPDGGSGTCLGHDIMRESAQIKRDVGYMTQRFSFYEDLTIRENLDFVARLYAVPDRKRAVETALERLGLAQPAARSSPASSRAAGSSGSRWPPACCTSRSCCCSTSRPPASIRRRGANSGTRSTCSPRRASPCWSPRITWTRPSAATASPTSPTASCSLTARREEVIAQSELTTWSVSGRGSRGLADATARACRASTMVVPFGSTLHVSGTDDARAGRRRSRHSAREPALAWTRGAAGLEDVFIHLMDDAPDNFDA